MVLELTVVDAFTSRPFSGNPAGVAVLDAFFDKARLQQIASEMNLSETAFVVPRAKDSYDLRWFTPTAEVELCGHATLASAHVVGTPATFFTASGQLTCIDKGNGWIEMDFPSDPPSEATPPARLGIEHAVGFSRTAGAALVELAEPSALRRLRVDLEEIAALARSMVIITAAGDRSGIDCVSRVFAPNVGIAEDPVTGSAHCVLAPYWAAKLQRLELVGEQASPRGGEVAMRLDGERVHLGGQAVTTQRVQLLV